MSGSGQGEGLFLEGAFCFLTPWRDPHHMCTVHLIRVAAPAHKILLGVQESAQLEFRSPASENQLHGPDGAGFCCIHRQDSASGNYRCLWSLVPVLVWMTTDRLRILHCLLTFMTFCNFFGQIQPYYALFQLVLTFTGYP